MATFFRIGGGPDAGSLKSEKPVFIFRKVVVGLFFPYIKKQEQAKSNRKAQSDDVDNAKCAVPDQVAPGNFDKIL
jgi:hypothetical protein